MDLYNSLTDTQSWWNAYTFRQCGHRAKVRSEISVHWKCWINLKKVKINTSEKYELLFVGCLLIIVLPGMYWSSVHRWPWGRQVGAVVPGCRCRCGLVPGWWCAYCPPKKNSESEHNWETVDLKQPKTWIPNISKQNNTTSCCARFCRSSQIQ